MHALEEIFHPGSIAVTGASQNRASRGYNYTAHLIDYGFRGKIYPVNPRYPEILGLKAYPSVRDIPEKVDYVISCVPAPQVMNMLEDCSRNGVKAVHLYTARFSETGNQEAANLEQEILRQARKYGIRLIGPNCMGLYYPQEGIAFAHDLPKESGPVGLISQTGGGAAHLVLIAGRRGIRFSKVISYGNGLDLHESDYLDYFAQDPETEVILMYIEGVRDGKRFIDALRHAASIKPVVVLKAGRGKSGATAAASHTASLAGSSSTWKAAIHQAGALFAESFEELIDLAVSVSFLPPIEGARTGIAGGGGGPSVLSADECEEEGLDVVPLPEDIRQELKKRVPEIWDWIGNPTDVSILGGFNFTSMDMLRLMSVSDGFDILIANITEVPLLGKEGTIERHKTEVKNYIEIRRSSPKPFLVVIGDKNLGIEDYSYWRWTLAAELRSELAANHMAFYPSMDRAARAAKKLLDYYRRSAGRQD